MTLLRRDIILLPALALIMASLLWASSFIALKFAFEHYDPMVVIFGRMLVATICFSFFWKNFQGLNYQQGDWKALLFMAFCEPCLYFLFEASALENTQASQAGMIVAMLPLLMAVAAHFLLGEIISRRTIAGFTLAVFGAFLLSFGAVQTLDAPNPVFGNMMEFLAMICATGYMITLKRLCTRYSPWFLTAVQAVVGALFFFPMLFLPTTTPPQTLEPGGLWAILYLGAVITIGAYGLYNYGISKIPAHQATAYTNLIPIMTLFLGWVLLGERLTGMQYAASAIVLVGVIMSQDHKKWGSAKNQNPKG